MRLRQNIFVQSIHLLGTEDIIYNKLGPVIIIHFAKCRAAASQSVILIIIIMQIAEQQQKWR
jgi:hypothetical protein